MFPLCRRWTGRWATLVNKTSAGGTHHQGGGRQSPDNYTQGINTCGHRVEQGLKVGKHRVGRGRGWSSNPWLYIVNVVCHEFQLSALPICPVTHRFTYPFIHWLIHKLLKPYDVPDTLLDLGNMMIKKTGSSATWASPVAQIVMNLPVIQETWVWSLDQKDPLGVEHGNPFQFSCLEKPMDRGACWATVHGVTKSDTIERLTLPVPHGTWGSQMCFAPPCLRTFTVTVPSVWKILVHLLHLLDLSSKVISMETASLAARPV